jgi:hypothetical protein
MPTGLPCPNPACQHVFSTEAIKGAASLMCPRCGKVFQFSAAPASSKVTKAKPPSSPAAPRQPVPPKAAPAVAMARPVVPAVPRADPVVPVATPVHSQSETVPNLDEPVVSPMVFRAKRRRKSPAGRRMFVTIFLLGLLGCGAWVIWYFRDDIKNSFYPEAAQEAKDFNYRFTMPANWSKDPDTKKSLTASGLKVRLAVRRNSPTAWMALLAKDVEKEKSLHGSDLQDEAVRSLNKFVTGLEWQRKEDDQLGDQPAKRIEFQGEIKSVSVAGECLMNMHQGFAYWLFTWAPSSEKSEAADEWVSARKGLEYLNQRELWKEKKRKSTTVTGTAIGYTLRFPDDVWEKQTPFGYENTTDLALLGTDPVSDTGNKHDAKRAATAHVLELPKEADLKAAMTAAQARLLKKQTVEDGYTGTKIDPVADEEGPIDRAADLGAIPGRIAHLRVKNSDSRERFVVMAVAVIDDQVMAVICECDWQRRAFWEQEFAYLLERFGRKGGKD